MSFFRGRHWPVLELGIFKWTCILFGVVVGAHFQEFIKQNLWVFLALTAAGTARVLYFYFHKSQRGDAAHTGRRLKE